MKTHFTRGLAVGAACVLAACTGPRTTTEPTAPRPSAHTPAGVPATASGALTLGQYHRDFAGHLSRANREHVFDGAPPNPLYAIVVMEVELDRDGHVVRVHPLRVPAHGKEQARLARASVLRAQPYPKPAVTVGLGKERLVFTETWLFQDHSRFQLRSLALPQQGE